MTRAEMLRAAANEIIVQGWCQDHFGGADKFDGPCCLVVALSRVVKTEGLPLAETCELFMDLVDPVRKVTGAKEGLAQWNDDPDRTVDDVLEALEQAANQVEEEKG